MSERFRQETESREREKVKAGQQEKMLRVQISNLNLALKAKPPLRQANLVAASPAPPNTRASKRLVGANSSLEILLSPPPPQKRTRLSEKKRRSESVSASAGKKKKKRDFLDDEDEEEVEDGSATEEEELEGELVLEDGDEGEAIDVDVEEEEQEEEVGALRLTVSYSGRGNPSVELGVKGSDTIRTLGKVFLALSGMKPTSFKGPTGIIYDRIRNKNKTVAELRGGTQMLNISALGCVRPT
ncbi:hypothetical protein BDY24DRAFT_392572 [Mrakia frigida]|uniref:uncharacterized protein n=1 Tax=Mrakia frigida TaxID=29902 RepID=UPI003FCC149B